MKLMTVLGTRPQLVKASALSRAVRRQGEIQEVLVDTGQHYDANMSKVFYDELGLPHPHHLLAIHGGSHGAQTAHMLERIEAVLMADRPAAVLVYGDTNSTLAGALAAVKLNLPVFHVEAGLRSGNRTMPEEVNRVLVDHMSELLFVPSQTAVNSLLAEGIAGTRVHQVGDIMYDVALFFGAQAESRSQRLTDLGLQAQNYVLMTVHRAANADSRQRLADIYAAAAALAKEIPVLWVLHPRTKKTLEEMQLPTSPSGLQMVEPVGYLDMTMLEKNALAIVTDSGGVQKEAYFHQVPCIVLREETEWVELVTKGYSVLCPPADVACLSERVQRALQIPTVREEHIYGDGQTAERILQTILSRYS